MRKEIIIAVVIGLTVGLVVAFGAWRANNSLKQAAPAEEIVSQSNPSPMITPALDKIQVNTPAANFLVDKELITVSGNTLPEATVVIIYTEGEKILTADSQGVFSTEISLAGGFNEIRITTIDNEGNQEERTITGVYSTAQI